MFIYSMTSFFFFFLSGISSVLFVLCEYACSRAYNMFFLFFFAPHG